MFSIMRRMSKQIAYLSAPRSQDVSEFPDIEDSQHAIGPTYPTKQQHCCRIIY